ncbi:MAG: rRNA pseudouridine synthase [Oscillospiraceae bacterium]|nr:rRNA pseudouridine synthase [Oscillospiraceae bacterium]
MQRLDKFLSEAGAASRKECRTLIRAGRITIGGVPAKSPEQKIDEQKDTVCLDGVRVQGYRLVTLLLHKPAGYVTSTDDPRDRTVMELVPEEYRRLGVVPAGRLDKETEGLLILTNDGALNHRITSPRRGMKKRYYAEHEGCAAEEDAAAFAEGLEQRDGTKCLPAELEPLGAGKSIITVQEGKYHQVRRMMAARGMHVNYLRRESEGGLTLEGVKLAEIRELSPEEVALLEE